MSARRTACAWLPVVEPDLALAQMDWALSLMATEEAEKEKKRKKKNKEEKEKDGEKKDDADKPKEEKADDAEGEEKEKDAEGEGEKKEVAAQKPAAPTGPMLDGMPEWFVGPLLADLVAHEVGHTLGLRHNFKASGLLTLDEINSKEVKGNKTFTASVMDYTPINYRLSQGSSGDYGMIAIGPYDYWAIEYGLSADDKKLAKSQTLQRTELQYATDEDTTDLIRWLEDTTSRKTRWTTPTNAQLIKLYRERFSTSLSKMVTAGPRHDVGMNRLSAADKRQHDGKLDWWSLHQPTRRRPG